MAGSPSGSFFARAPPSGPPRPAARQAAPAQRHEEGMEKDPSLSRKQREEAGARSSQRPPPPPPSGRKRRTSALPPCLPERFRFPRPFFVHALPPGPPFPRSPAFGRGADVPAPRKNDSMLCALSRLFPLFAMQFMLLPRLFVPSCPLPACGKRFSGKIFSFFFPHPFLFIEKAAFLAAA